MPEPVGTIDSLRATTGICPPQKRSRGAVRIVDDDLARIKDATERKNVQNRIAQRAYRKRVRSGMVELENFRDAITTAQLPVFESSTHVTQQELLECSPSQEMSALPTPKAITPEALFNTSCVEDEKSPMIYVKQPAGYFTAPATPSVEGRIPQEADYDTSAMETAELGCAMSTELSLHDFESVLGQHALVSPPSLSSHNVEDNHLDILPDGKTALHIAAKNGDLSTVQLLLNLQPNLVEGDSMGRTVLHSAVCNQQQAILDELLKHSIALEAQDWKGQTALHIAAASGFESGVTSLLTAGATLEAKDTQGRTPFHLAATYGQDTVLQLLFIRGANINAKME